MRKFKRKIRRDDDYIISFFLRIILASIFALIAFLLIQSHKNLKDNPKYNFEHNFIDHGDIRYYIKDDKYLEIYKLKLIPYTPFRHGVQLHPNTTIHYKKDWKLYKTIEFNLD